MLLQHDHASPIMLLGRRRNAEILLKRLDLCKRCRLGGTRPCLVGRGSERRTAPALASPLSAYVRTCAREVNRSLSLSLSLSLFVRVRVRV